MTINDRVKEIRKAEGLTLAKFGEKLGVTNMAISNIENGNRSVTGQMLKSICREFGYREEWLRDGIEPKQPPKLEEDEHRRSTINRKPHLYANQKHSERILQTG